MASRNQIAELQPPSLGVRADLDDRALPPDALAVAKNILNTTGAIVPRPGHTAYAIGQPWRGVHVGYSSRGVCHQPHGPVLVGFTDFLDYSEDLLTWTSHSMGTSSKVMEVLVCCPTEPHWYVFDSDTRMWRADAGWPGKGGGFIDQGRVYGTGIKTTSAAMNPATGYMICCIQHATNYVSLHCEDPTAASPTWTGLFNGAAGSTGPSVAVGGGVWAVVDAAGSIKVATDKSGLIWSDFTQKGPGGSINFGSVASDGVDTFVTIGQSGSDTVIYGSTNTGAAFSLRATISSKVPSRVVHLYGTTYLVITTTATYTLDASDWSVTAREAPGQAGTISCLGATVLPDGHVIVSVAGDGLYSHQRWGSRPTSIVQYDADDEERAIVMATEHSVLRLDQLDDEWDDLTPGNALLTGSAPRATMVWRTFEKGGRTLLLGTNGVDPPIVYDPLETYYRKMGGSAPVAKCMAVSANRVMLCGLASGGTVSDQAVDVSAFNNPDDGWGTVQVSLLGDTPGGIVAAMEISSLQTAIYMTDAIYHSIAQVEFLGVAAPFRYELVASGIQGPCSPLSLARIEGTQVYMARDGGVYIHEGAGLPRDVGPHVRALVQPNFDDDQPQAGWVVYDEYHHLLWCFYPHVTAGMSQGFVLVTDRGWPWPLYEVTLPSSWEAVAGARAFLRTELTIGDLTSPLLDYDTAIGDWVDYDAELVVALDDGSIKKQTRDTKTTWDDDGTAIAVEWKTGVNPLGERMHFKTVQETHEQFSDLTAGQTFNVSVIGVDEQGAEQTSGPVAVSSTTRYYKTGHRLTERLFRHRVTASISRYFEWHGADIILKYRGRR